MNQSSTGKTKQTNLRIIGAILILALVVICSYGLYNILSSVSDPTNPLSGAKTGNGGEFSEAANELYRVCFQQPEVLAATMSAFPQHLRTIGIEDADPAHLDDLIDSENGGEIQRVLLDLLKELLEDPNTQFAFAEWSGQVDMIYMDQRDPDAPDSSSNYYLYWETTKLNNAKIFGMEIGNTPEQREFAYFYLDGGFQRFVPKIS